MHTQWLPVQSRIGGERGERSDDVGEMKYMEAQPAHVCAHVVRTYVPYDMCVSDAV